MDSCWANFGNPLRHILSCHQHPTCDNPPVPHLFPHSTRREFLVRSGAGFGAVALSAMLQAEARSAAPGPLRSVIDPLNPFAPRAPQFAPKATSVIFLFM